MRVEVDVDLALEAAPDIQGGHAGDAFDAVLDLVVDDASQFDRVEAAGGAEDEDGETGEVELAERGAVGLLGQARMHAIEPVAHVVGGGVEVGAPGKGDADAAGALRGGGGDFLDAGDGAHGLLDGPGDEFLDLLGAGVFVGGRRRSRSGR